MVHVQRVQKKTSTMSLTISSCSSTASSSRDHFSCSPSSSSSSSSNLLTQKHSSLVQPLCVSPQRTQSPVYTQPAGGGVAPTFVKCLHDVTTLKGQLVVLECRLRGPPPLQVMWYREEEKILDSDDFRILRKKASSAPVPEELCTLVITEAFPEDSGLFKCVAINPFGTVSCCAALEVYHDMEEQLEMEAVHQQKMVSAQEDVEDMFHPGTSGRQSCEDSPPPFSDSMNPDPPDWPDVCVDDDVTAAVFPSPQLSTRCSEGPPFHHHHHHHLQPSCSPRARSLSLLT
ncbi:palladin [Cynoglossus semilaevis]|uniref:palladin n=1 Tax=Cynoglossus semilaevis TaxID=244447 RepID=UPI000D625D2F|nr:palladin [Cynoglossus semilaevis]